MGGSIERGGQVATESASKLSVAVRAYDQTYEGAWGLKASEEDALLSVINALYPEFATEAAGIYAIRDDARLADIAEWLYDFANSDEVCRSDNPSMEIVTALIPKLEDVLGAVARQRPRRNAEGQKIVRITANKSDDSDFDSASGFRLTVPANIARMIGGNREFAVELTDEGILYRAVSGDGRDLPKWVKA